VEIGGKTWMAENLNYETDSSWCYDNSADSCNKYGRLYDWNTAMASSPSSTENPSGVRGVCPFGWHLPSRQEWGDLAKAAGGEDEYGQYGNAGTKLKSASGWNSCNQDIPNGENEYKFSALPGGYYYEGEITDFGKYGAWWTATEDYDNFAYIRSMGNCLKTVSEDKQYKSKGHSVRCVKND